MRRLAGELGVGTMTLYHYFPSKQDLLDAVVEVAFAGDELPLLQGSWRDRLRALCRAGRSALSRHPSLVQIRARQPILQRDALRFGEVGLGILEEAGFEREEAARAFRLLFTYTLGFAILSPEGGEKEAEASARAALAGLPVEYYPRLSEAVDEAAKAMAGEPVFDYGLERILDGLEARLGAAT